MPPTLPEPQPDEVAMAIGANIANLVDDRGHHPLGIGEIPNAAALMLKDKKDLGVHTEMLVDSMMELYEMGVITNKAKSVHKGSLYAHLPWVAKSFYKWLDNNPAVEFLRASM